MGTNFYIRRKPTKQERDKMVQMVANAEYQALKDYLNKCTIEYHIGLNSCGWQFLFASYPENWCRMNNVAKPWDDNLASIKKCIEDSSYEIVDEYNKVYTPDEFWKIAGSKLYYVKDKYTNSIEEHRAGKIKYIVDIARYEYINAEGLRFARDPDFS